MFVFVIANFLFHFLRSYYFLIHLLLVYIYVVRAVPVIGPLAVQSARHKMNRIIVLH